MLSKIEISFNITDETISIDDISDVKISNIATTHTITIADYAGKDDSISATGSNNNGVTLKDINERNTIEGLLIPQQLENATISFSANGRSFVSNIKDNPEFESGMMYEYCLNIAKDEDGGISLTAKSISEWKPAFEDPKDLDVNEI